jgi:hypothetical protein
MRARLAAAAILAFAATSPLHAQTITSRADAALTGKSTIDFGSAAIGSYNTLTIDGVTFTPGAGELFFIDDQYAGQYNTVGRYLTDRGNSFSSLRFDFGGVVSAFGFQFGASDYVWTLRAYDAFDMILASTSISPTGGSNAGDFFGLTTGSANISYATLSAGDGDYVMVDNFDFVRGPAAADVTVTPEPATVALFATGLLGLVGVARRKRGTLPIA